MLNQPNNAQSVEENHRREQASVQYKQTQLNELKQQTQNSSDIKMLTLANIECIKNILDLTTQNTQSVKQIEEMTLENQKSSQRQFCASIIIAGAALVVSIIALFVK